MSYRIRIVRNDVDTVIVATAYDVKCACVWQAWFSSAHGKPRKDDVVIVTDWRGDVIERADWPKCRVDPRNWTWRHHGHCHTSTMTNEELDAKSRVSELWVS